MQTLRHPARFFTAALPDLLLGTALCLGLCLIPRLAEAQTSALADGAAGGIAVGGDLDNYLRYLQTMGKIPMVPWSLRGFSPEIADSLTRSTAPHPWARTWEFQHRSQEPLLRVLPAEVSLHYNSGFPYGINEGPVWSGRGVTAAVTGGVRAAWGPLSLVAQPVLFWAQNQTFPLAPVASGYNAFADPLFPGEIDRPQRFGNGYYARVEPGETTVRLDAYGAALGVTSANEWWGPATVFPYVVGNNAAGVPRAFLGTSRPANIYIGTLQARVEYGLEFQSAYSPVVGPKTFLNVDSTGQRRLMSSLAFTFVPGAIPTLELGGGRYFHRPWMGHVTAADLKSPLEGLLTASPLVTSSTTGSTSSELSNQLASVWARWVFPASGLEVYGEYGHEDHNIDLQDLLSELDHSRTALLGFRKTVRVTAQQFDALRAEVFDGTASTVARHRGEGLIYVHSPLLQGHTEEGKVIGNGAGIGSPSGLEIAWQQYRATGERTYYVRRTSENTDVFPSLDPPQTSFTAGATVDRLRAHDDVSGGIAIVHQTGSWTPGSSWNLNLTIGVRTHRI